MGIGFRSLIAPFFLKTHPGAGIIRVREIRPYRGVARTELQRQLGCLVSGGEKADDINVLLGVSTERVSRYFNRRVRVLLIIGSNR
jgi:hypothetical protein